MNIKKDDYLIIKDILGYLGILDEERIHWEKSIGDFFNSSDKLFLIFAERNLTEEEKNEFKKLNYKARKKAIEAFYAKYWQPVVLALNSIGCDEDIKKWAKNGSINFFELNTEQFKQIPNIPLVGLSCLCDIGTDKFSKKAFVESVIVDVKKPSVIYQIDVLVYDIYENEKRNIENCWTYFVNTQFENPILVFSEGLKLKNTNDKHIFVHPEPLESEYLDQGAKIYEIINTRYLGENLHLNKIVTINQEEYIQCWSSDKWRKPSLKNMKDLRENQLSIF